ncbi:hypothetical protein [Algivirga pacifica]|uniref:helix-turn-helix transcriptional regulator n=1 Tax=Algivirga pacifica TaxID=1162670 RepID=UPI0031EAA6F7
MYTQAYQQAYISKDSTSLVSALVGRAQLQAHHGQFGDAYDDYWNALFIADATNNNSLRVLVYHGLGWLYSFYEREELSKNYFNQAIQLLKADESIQRLLLVDNYYALATLARKKQNTALARTYLDSCLQVKKKYPNIQNDNSFINAEFGYNAYIDGHYQQALTTLIPLEQFFTETSPSYLVIYHYFMGLIHRKLGQSKSAEISLKKALKESKLYKSHADLIPLIYEELSQLFLASNKNKEAYAMLIQAKQFNESFYGSRNSKNQKILEIKDLYRKEKQRQKELIQQQELERLTQENHLNYLRALILYVALAAIILVSFFIYRNIRNKHKAKQMLLIQKQKLEEEKMQEVLEVKNKELTASVLQIIQHEETLADIKKSLAEQIKKPDSQKLNKLSKRINLNTDLNWKEFEARFIEVNGNFYKELNQRFPDLTQGDQKICALIKLNFDSKGMARLLGISTESVHTTRYRIRKKLGLSRTDNLEEFISQIG